MGIKPNEEFLVAARFYFSTQQITDRQVLAVSGITFKSAAASKNLAVGAAKYGMHYHQPTPTAASYGEFKVKLVVYKDGAVQKWYRDANKQHTSTGNTWAKSIQTAWLVGYDQEGKEIVRWEFEDSYPTSYTLNPVSASSGDMMSEEVTVAFSEFSTLGRGVGDL